MRLVWFAFGLVRLGLIRAGSIWVDLGLVRAGSVWASLAQSDLFWAGLDVFGLGWCLLWAWLVGCFSLGKFGLG